ncbi:unnamed protein product [Protopolystoma xenopodis]|uniref:Uncharacterized protein n=1 Tax=Protopolystoma xenopodis TaxID=117903 RepID=A0A3S5BVG8_9PLAT|nr:unnamed protein product [Protopolystoma xenopodis]
MGGGGPSDGMVRGCRARGCPSRDRWPTASAPTPSAGRERQQRWVLEMRQSSFAALDSQVRGQLVPLCVCVCAEIVLPLVVMSERLSPLIQHLRDGQICGAGRLVSSRLVSFRVPVRLGTVAATSWPRRIHSPVRAGRHGQPITARRLAQSYGRTGKQAGRGRLRQVEAARLIGPAGGSTDQYPSVGLLSQ